MIVSGQFSFPLSCFPSMVWPWDSCFGGRYLGVSMLYNGVHSLGHKSELFRSV